MIESWPTDLGPIYRETQMGRWPVEPWNTWSTLPFLFISLYWLWKIRHHLKKNKLIFITSSLTTVGFIGGFIYHSTRSHMFWLFLDWLPIIIIANITSFSLWRKTSKHLGTAIIGAYVPLLCSLPLYLSNRFQSIFASSLGYLAMAFTVVIPMVRWVHKTKYQHILWLGLAGFSLSSAVFLRTFDKHPVMDIFPAGTHFLWHLLGAMTLHFMTKYIYKTYQ